MIKLQSWKSLISSEENSLQYLALKLSQQLSRKQKFRLFNFTGLAGLMLGCFCLLLPFASARADVKEVNNQELVELRESGAVLIDIRRADEWAYSGVIEGSHLLTFFDMAGRYDVEGWLKALKKIVPENEPFVLICEVGGRSGSVSRLLDKQLGIQSVHNLSRGIRPWIAEGRKVVPPGPLRQ